MKTQLGLALAALLLAANVAAQPTEEQRAQWRAQREARGGGDYNGPRPAENATPEERRAFWQKVAAERRAAEAVATDGDHSAHGSPAQTQPAAPAPGNKADAKPAGKAAVPPAPTIAAPPGNPTRGAGMPPGARGGGAIWLSDSPPSRGDGPPRGMGGMPGMGMGGMAMGGERTGPPVKRLWLRAGADPQKSGFAREDAEAPPELLLISPNGKPEGEPLPPAEEGKRNLSFPMPVQGFYRLYAVVRKLNGDTLNVSVAKAEVANFTHGGDEEERAKAIKADRVLESAPMEIVRERQPDEKPFFRLRSGDEQAFVVLQKGLPVQGARVRFASHSGWVKEAISDEQGRISFQIVRDYFPPWQEFQKRFKATYLLIAETTVAESGKHNDQPYSQVRYQTTLSGAYYPSPDDYRSYAWGLGIGLLATVLLGWIVWLYRRRRVKPYQEVRFDESK
jgi:hypothetical protein